MYALASAKEGAPGARPGRHSGDSATEQRDIPTNFVLDCNMKQTLCLSEYQLACRSQFRFYMCLRWVTCFIWFFWCCNQNCLLQLIHINIHARLKCTATMDQNLKYTTFWICIILRSRSVLPSNGSCFERWTYINMPSQIYGTSAIQRDRAVCFINDM